MRPTPPEIGRRLRFRPKNARALQLRHQIDMRQR